MIPTTNEKAAAIHVQIFLTVLHRAYLSLSLLEERIRTLSGESVGGRPTYVSTRSNLFSKIFLSSAHTKELISPE